MTRFFSVLLRLSIFLLSLPAVAASEAAFDYARLFPIPSAQDQKALGIDNEGVAPSALAASDFNRDGLPDLAVSYAFSDRVRWFAGVAGGGFTPGGEMEVGTRSGIQNDGPRQLIARDFNEDGFIDLLVVCSGLPPESGFPIFLLNGPSVGILFGRPGGFDPYHPLMAFNSAESNGPEFALRAAAGLFGRTNRLSLAVAFTNSRQVGILKRALDGLVYENDQNALELLPVNTPGKGPYSVLAADLNKDGLAELILINEKDVQIWLNGGETGFGSRLILAFGQGLTAGAAADFDSNGHWDLAVADGAADQIRIFMNVTPDAHAARVINLPLPAGSGPVEVKVCDANLDGQDDLAAACLTGTDGGRLWLNQIRQGQDFIPSISLNGSLNPRAIEAIDLNHDQQPEFALANEGDKSPQAQVTEDVTFTRNQLPIPPATELKFDAPFAPGAQHPPYLDRPVGLAWDHTRQAYWTIDRRVGRLVCVQTSGTIIRQINLAKFAGQGLIDPKSLASDASGGLWLLDSAAMRIFLVNPGLETATYFEISFSGLVRPSGIAFDPTHARLLVSDSREKHLLAFSTSGQKLATYVLDERVSALTFNPADQTLWGVSLGLDSRLIAFREDTGEAGFHRVGEIHLGEAGKIFAAARLQGLACNPSTGHLAGLTAEGTWAEFANESLHPSLLSIREWSFLRVIQAVARLEEGALLVADGGLQASLVKISAQGRIISTIFLNGSSQAPVIEVRGLATGTGLYFVLDGGSRMVRMYSPDGILRGSIPVPLGAGSRLGGLSFDEANHHLRVGSDGRIVELELAPAYDNPQAAYVRDFPVSAAYTPSSLPDAQSEGEIALFYPEQNLIQTSGTNATSPAATQTITRWRSPGSNFEPLAIDLPAGPGQRGYLVGAGTTTLIPFTLGLPPSAARAWTNYE